MKKFVYFFLFLLPLNLYSNQSLPEPPIYNINFDPNLLTPISSAEWFNMFYLKVADSKDKKRLQNFLNEWSLQTKKGISELEQLGKQLQENPDQFELISEKILQATNLSSDIEDFQTLQGWLAFASIMSVFAIPQSYSDQPLATHQDFIDEMPKMIEFLTITSQRSDECLHLITRAR